MKIKYKKCNEIIEDKKNGAYISCKCGLCAIDQSKYYCRIIANKEDYEILEESE